MKTADFAQIVTFRLGDDLFAADINSVERVLRHQAPSPVPNVPEWIEGVVEYQQRVLPVVDLRARFGMPRAALGSDARLLVLNGGDGFVAVTVDAVLEVAPLDPSRLTPPPPLFRGLAGEYLKGIVRRADRLVIFLDVARLLSATERLTLEAATGSGSDAAADAVATSAVAAAEAVLPAAKPGRRARRG